MEKEGGWVGGGGERENTISRGQGDENKLNMGACSDTLAPLGLAMLIDGARDSNSSDRASTAESRGIRAAAMQAHKAISVQNSHTTSNA
jgi:hypothetical protein